MGRFEAADCTLCHFEHCPYPLSGAHRRFFRDRGAPQEQGVRALLGGDLCGGVVDLCPSAAREAAQLPLGRPCQPQNGALSAHSSDLGAHHHRPGAQEEVRGKYERPVLLQPGAGNPRIPGTGRQLPGTFNSGTQFHAFVGGEGTVFRAPKPSLKMCIPFGSILPLIPKSPFARSLCNPPPTQKTRWFHSSVSTETIYTTFGIPPDYLCLIQMSVDLQRPR